MSSKSDGGKGSSPRPFSVSQEEYDKRWDAIFGRNLKDEPQDNKRSEEEEESFKPDAWVADVGEKPTKEELEEIENQENEDDSLQCPSCGGVDTMYVTQVGFHSVCDQCGYRERLEPDYD